MRRCDADHRHPIDACRKLTGNAVVVLAPDLVSALVARVPALLRMVDPGGSLVVPVHLEGTPSEVEVSSIARSPPR